MRNYKTATVDDEAHEQREPDTKHEGCTASHGSTANRYVGLCDTPLIPLVGKVGSAESWRMLHIDDRKVERREAQSRQRKRNGDGDGGGSGPRVVAGSVPSWWSPESAGRVDLGRAGEATGYAGRRMDGRTDGHYFYLFIYMYIPM